MSDHGYIKYTHGCRCEVCHAAKADYMRARRADARALAQKHTATSDGKPGNSSNAWAPGATRFVANTPRHGTRYGYEEAGCRCMECTNARMTSDARYRRKDAS